MPYDTITCTSNGNFILIHDMLLGSIDVSEIHIYCLSMKHMTKVTNVALNVEFKLFNYKMVQKGTNLAC